MVRSSQIAAAAIRARDAFPSCFDPATRSLMEHRLGRELRDVQIVTGQAARAAAAGLGAQAYACGGTIVLGSELDLATPHGLWLLTHELAHVVQQRNGRDTYSRESIDTVALETIASEVADIVASG